MFEKTDYVLVQLHDDQLSINSAKANNCVNTIGGSLSNIRNLFENRKLTGDVLEGAINYAEDLIMPMLLNLPKVNTLMVDGPELESVVRHLITKTNNVTVTLESIEELYRQLVNYSEGSHYAWREEISPESIALGLVVLRELMHHGGFRFASMLPQTR